MSKQLFIDIFCDKNMVRNNNFCTHASNNYNKDMDKAWELDTEKARKMEVSLSRNRGNNHNNPPYHNKHKY